MADVDEQLGVDDAEALDDIAVDPANIPVDNVGTRPSPDKTIKRFRAPTDRSATEDASNVPEGGWRGRLSNGFNRLSGGAPRNLEQKKEEAKEKIKEEAKSAVKKEAKAVAKNVAKKAGARIAAAGARAVALATSEIWGPIVLVLLAIVGVIIIIAIIVAIAQSGQFGSSFHQDSDKNTQMTALANAGDVFARRELDAADIPLILKALDTIEQKAKNKNDIPALDIIKELRTKLQTYTSGDSKVDRQNLIDAQKLILKLSSLGYGTALTQFTTSAALAELSKLIDKKRIGTNHDNDEAGLTSGYIKRKLSRPGTPDPVPLNPMVPLFLLAIDREFGPVIVSSIVGTHPRETVDDKGKSTGRQSAHWTGNGMDIAAIRGKAVDSNQTEAKDLLQWVLDHQSELEQKGIRISQTIGPAQYSNLQLRRGQKITDGSQGVKSGHEDHFHIGFYPIGGLQ